MGLAAHAVWRQLRLVRGAPSRGGAAAAGQAPAANQPGELLLNIPVERYTMLGRVFLLL